jgi:Protein of unknown function, DUF547.
MRSAGAAAVLIFTLTLGARAQDAVSKVDALYRPLDQLLDLYVRDGFVYYNALRIERGGLDRFVASLDGPAAIAQAKGTPAQQRAFWINAYNAFVLRTVIDNYPIRGRSAAYPPGSVRQIPGAFERLTHRVAGRTLTLDSIEKDILVPLGDPRVFLALGRGAIGGGRLRSEALDADTIDAQLDRIAAESLTRKEVVRVDQTGNELEVSPIFSWREEAFVAALADKAHRVFADRSPLERAVLALIGPHLLTSEAEFLEKNNFRMVFSPFDWRLNDLGNRP